MSDQAYVLRAVDSPTSDRQDYLKKRHMREGPSRRRLGTLDALDVDLDQRNARVWREVSHACLAVAGLSPLVSYDTNARDSESRRAHDALCAAARICNEDYGIPTARLAELAEITPQAMGRRVRKENLTVLSHVAAWRETHAGFLGAETALIEITKEAALALAKAARESGDSPIALASAAVLAASPRLPR